jgi:hypothetical protein
LSRYGEDLHRPTLTGILIIFLSTFFFVTQSNPELYPAFPSIFSTKTHKVNPDNASSPIKNNSKSAANNATYSTFAGLDKVLNPDQWSKAFERSIGDFLPVITLPSNFKIGLMDFLIKIVGGALTFALLAIALRRRFERRFRH